MKSYPKFVPLYIETDDIDYYFENNKVLISNKIVDAISYCLDNNRKKLMIAEIAIPNSDETLLLSVHEEDFLDNLDRNLKILKQYEDIDGCLKTSKVTKKLIEKWLKNKELDDVIKNIF